jgi:hypothetical protein
VAISPRVAAVAWISADGIRGLSHAAPCGESFEATHLPLFSRKVDLSQGAEAAAGRAVPDRRSMRCKQMATGSAPIPTPVAEQGHGDKPVPTRSLQPTGCGTP